MWQKYELNQLRNWFSRLFTKEGMSSFPDPDQLKRKARQILECRERLKNMRPEVLGKSAIKGSWAGLCLATAYKTFGKETHEEEPKSKNTLTYFDMLPKELTEELAKKENN